MYIYCRALSYPTLNTSSLACPVILNKGSANWEYWTLRPSIHWSVYAPPMLTTLTSGSSRSRRRAFCPLCVRTPHRADSRWRPIHLCLHKQEVMKVMSILGITTRRTAENHQKLSLLKKWPALQGRNSEIIWRGYFCLIIRYLHLIAARFWYKKYFINF